MNRHYLTAYQELQLYQLAFDSAMQLFEQSQTFPETEQSLLTQNLLQSSRWVCIHIAGAWSRRRYQNAFIAKLNDAETRAAEAQCWIEFAIFCHYLNAETGQELDHAYRTILIHLDRLIENAPAWCQP